MLYIFINLSLQPKEWKIIFTTLTSQAHFFSSFHVASYPVIPFPPEFPTHSASFSADSQDGQCEPSSSVSADARACVPPLLLGAELEISWKDCDSEDGTGYKWLVSSSENLPPDLEPSLHSQPLPPPISRPRFCPSISLPRLGTLA